MTETISIEQEGENAARAAFEECIRDGGIAIFPADTLYGLACDPLSKAGVERIHGLKGRDDGKPSAVMYFTPLAMRELIVGLGERTADALGALLPGPVTLVIANPERRYPLACRDDPERLGVRLLDGPLSGMPLPVFQTSANRSGFEPPSDFDGIAPEILAGVDLAIDGGKVGGAPSTVVDLSEIDAGGGWRVLREGAVPAEEISEKLQSASG